ncbi:hypothetical protein B7494_g8497 [Chlorociboria aeruginascens]|nr:hypothetical protein B7494_g8497 [Chlorociboria aeruginascens]
MFDSLARFLQYYEEQEILIVEKEKKNKGDNAEANIEGYRELAVESDGPNHVIRRAKFTSNRYKISLDSLQSAGDEVMMSLDEVVFSSDKDDQEILRFESPRNGNGLSYASDYTLC